MNNEILLQHGSGGKLSKELFGSIFGKYFGNPILDKLTDSAVLEIEEGKLAFTTDTYVVSPLFFPGGNIGKLAVCGTVNDLSVSGAVPRYLSAGFVIEEGFEIDRLEEIVKTMGEEARRAGVFIVTGDTKVVDRGKCDGVYINTAGVGFLKNEYAPISTGENVKPGDVIIINGTLGDHGMAIMAERKNLNIKAPIYSDCAPLNGIIQDTLGVSSRVNFMRDATRGGLATVLCELVENRNFGIRIDENLIPVREEVLGMCEMLGFDPLYIANEGKMLMVVDSADSEKVLSVMKESPEGKDAVVIGEIVEGHPGRVILDTEIGGKRIVEMRAGDQLPRIC